MFFNIKYIAIISSILVGILTVLKGLLDSTVLGF